VLVNELKGHGVEFVSIRESLDTTTAGGRLVYHVFGAVAEFERDLILERTMAGLEAARARGRNGGRPRKLDARKLVLASRLMRDRETPAERGIGAAWQATACVWDRSKGDAPRPKAVVHGGPGGTRTGASSSGSRSSRGRRRRSASCASATSRDGRRARRAGRAGREAPILGPKDRCGRGRDVAVSPSVKRSLVDAETPRDLGNWVASGELRLYLSGLSDNLLRRLPFARLRETSFRRSQAPGLST